MIYPESHLAITPQTLQGALSYADITRRLLPSSNSQAVMSAVDRIHSIYPSLIPSTHSTHTLNQPSLSMSPPSHARAPAITKKSSSRTCTARGILPGDPASDGRSGGAPSELPHAPDEVEASAYPNEQSLSSPSASPRRPPLPPGRADSAVGSPSQPRPVSGLRRYSLIQEKRDDAVAAVCPPAGHSQSIEVYRSDRSHSPHGVRQLEPLSSPKI